MQMALQAYPVVHLSECSLLHIAVPGEPWFEVASPATCNSLACGWCPLKNDQASSRQAFGSRVEIIRGEAVRYFPSQTLLCIGVSERSPSKGACVLLFFLNLRSGEITR